MIRNPNIKLRSVVDQSALSFPPSHSSHSLAPARSCSYVFLGDVVGRKEESYEERQRLRDKKCRIIPYYQK
ncbi:hypothetical protein Q5P01_021708 [Channa striata]|uniref:Uncharacterized protein n=1 Tax=Channa striata TaxID=64152 RepID=A0AA88LW92_CHASR|nr:hypothetical protein Q5P01_021708 [Channa striata]